MLGEYLLCKQTKDEWMQTPMKLGNRAWPPSLCTLSCGFLCLFDWSRSQGTQQSTHGDTQDDKQRNQSMPPAQPKQAQKARAQNKLHPGSLARAAINKETQERIFPLPTYFHPRLTTIFSKKARPRLADVTCGHMGLGPPSSGDRPGLTSAAGTPSGGRQCSTIMPSRGTSLPCGSCSKFFRKSAKNVRDMTLCSGASRIHICSKNNKTVSLMSQPRYTHTQVTGVKGSRIQEPTFLNIDKYMWDKSS